MLALAEGLSPEAGESVMLVRNQPDSTTELSGTLPTMNSGSPPTVEATEEVDLRALLESSDSRHNVIVNPGDVVQVRAAGMFYVIGDVNQPGGFPLNQSEPLSVLQGVAMAEGLKPTAAAGSSVILRPMDGDRREIPVDLGQVMSGSAPDAFLQAEDILFVPKSMTRSVARGVLDAFIRMATLRGILY